MRLRVFFDTALAGHLERHRRGKDEQYLFAYDATYLNAAGARPVSVNLPLQKEPFAASELFPFFDNLLAEGWLLDIQATTYKIDHSDRFALIQHCGLECIGAVSLRGDQND